MRWGSLCLFGALITPGIARATDWDLIVSNRFYAESLPADVLDAQLRVPSPLSPTSERAAYQLHVLGAVRTRASDLVGFELSLDSGLIEVSTDGVFADGQRISDRAKETFFLGETVLDLQFGATGVLELRAGKIRPRIGDGAIFDAYAFGLTADWDQSLVDHDNPWRFRLHALLPDATFTSQSKQSPLFAAEIGYAFAPHSEVRFFGAAFLDSEDGLTPVLADAVFRGRLQGARNAVIAAFPVDRPLLKSIISDAISEGYRQRVIGYDVESHGTLGWLGLTTRARDEELEVSGALILGLGKIEMNSSPNQGVKTAVERIKSMTPRVGEVVEPILAVDSASEVTLLSYFADASMAYHFTPELAGDAFAVVMSGDSGLSERPADPSDKYSSFVALAPLLPFTAIFFRGGVATSLASPVVASVAPDGAGLVGGGGGVTLSPIDVLNARISLAALGALVPSKSTGSGFYGIEADAEIDLQVLDFLALSTQGAIFRPGKYFGDLPVGYQVIGAVHVLLP